MIAATLTVLVPRPFCPSGATLANRDEISSSAWKTSLTQPRYAGSNLDVKNGARWGLGGLRGFESTGRRSIRNHFSVERTKWAKGA